MRCRPKTIIFSTVLIFVLFCFFPIAFLSVCFLFNTNRVSASVTVLSGTHLGFQNGAYMNFATSATFSSAHMEGYYNTSWYGWWFFDGVGVWSNVNVTFSTQIESSLWVNYSVVSSSGSQGCLAGLGSPSVVYVDGAVDFGWSYSGGVLAVSGATSTVWVYFGAAPVTYVKLSVDTWDPSNASLGFQVTVNLAPYSTPYSMMWANSSVVSVVAPSSVTLSLYRYDFTYWNDSMASNTYATVLMGNLSIAAIYSGTYVGPSNVTVLGNAWYFQSGTHTVNNYTGYMIGTSAGSSLTQINETNPLAGLNLAFGYRVWLTDYNGYQTELSSGYPVAVVYKLAGDYTSGYLNSSWVPTYAILDVGVSAVKVVVYVSFNGSAWIPKAVFTTSALSQKSIGATTWTFRLWCGMYSGSTVASFSYGDASHASCISGVSLLDASTFESMLALLASGQLFSFFVFPFTSRIGGLFYGLLLLVPAVTLWHRYHNFTLVAVMSIMLGGVGGVFSMILPAVALPWAWIGLVIGITILLYRVFR